MGAWWSTRLTQSGQLCEPELDLQESLVSLPEWETKSWLEYSFKREIVNVPSSLSGSWLVLDTDPLLRSPSDHNSSRIDGLGQSDSEDNTGGLVQEPSEDHPYSSMHELLHSAMYTLPGDVTEEEQCIGHVVGSQEGTRLVTETGVCGGVGDVRSVFEVPNSLQRTPVHAPQPFRSNRSFTFSFDIHSPKQSQFSGDSVILPCSPQTGESYLTSSLTKSPFATEKGLFIAGLFQAHFTTIVEQMRVQETLTQLYNLVVLDRAELERANSPLFDENTRAKALIHHLQRKLTEKPELFPDVFAALRKAGVEVAQEIKAEVRRRYPEDTELESSIISYGEPTSSITSNDCSDLGPVVFSLEETVRENRLSTAREIISTELLRNNGSSLLFEACRPEVNVCVLNILLSETSLDVNSCSKHNRTPLHTACAALKQCSQASKAEDQPEDQTLKIKSLLEHGADPTTQDEDGNTVLHLAVLRGDLEAVRIVLDHSTLAIDLTNKLGNTALHIACREGLPQLVRLLCDYGASITTPNIRNGKTPLHCACKCVGGDVEVMTPLLSRDSSSEYINAKDGKGDTALHVAGRHGHKACIKLLIAKGAAKYIKNQDGRTAVDLAVQFNHNRVAEAQDSKSPWLKRRRTRSVEAISQHRVSPYSSLPSRGMELYRVDSDHDETLD